MTSIYQDKENQTAGAYVLPHKTIGGSSSTLLPKTPFAKKANAARTPLVAKNENVNRHAGAGAGKHELRSKYRTPLKTPVAERRVPLGGKDTNAQPSFTTQNSESKKAPVKSTSARRRKQLSDTKLSAKQQVKAANIAPAVSLVDVVEDVEYMPPQATGALSTPLCTELMLIISEIPFVCDDFEPIDYGALKSAMFSNDIIADYQYPRDKDGKTEMARRVEHVARQALDDALNYIQIEEPAVGSDGLHDFERPLLIEGVDGLDLALDFDLDDHALDDDLAAFSDLNLS
ncbi:uncharacterized protein V1518DRAFT_450036 [Limtongia smithiae]|uniref:uncharacterized protein n=1 Tax=Limtongia smithiae TaxID=1125753 RepID=UPI0034CE78E3